MIHVENRGQGFCTECGEDRPLVFVYRFRNGMTLAVCAICNRKLHDVAKLIGTGRAFMVSV